MPSAGFVDTPQFKIVADDGSMVPAKYTPEQAAAIRARDTISLAITPGGRVGDASPLAKPGYKGKRKLSDYEREVAHALMRKGHSKKRAIKMARGIIRNAATLGKWGRGKVRNPAVRAGAAASIAQRKSFSVIDPGDIDLARFFPSFGISADQNLAASLVMAREEKLRRSRGKSVPGKVRGAPGKAAKRSVPPASRVEKVALAKRLAAKMVEHNARAHHMTVEQYKRPTGSLTQDAEAKNRALARRRTAGYGGDNPSNPSKASKAKKRGAGHHVPGTAYRFKHGWIPVASLSEADGLFLDLSNAAKEFDLDLVAKWKHGFIPLNAEAMAIKLHHKKGNGPHVGSPNPMVSAKFHTAKAKAKMSHSDLRAHAETHAHAAAAAKTPEAKRKHIREAQSSMDEVLRRQHDQRSVTPMIPTSKVTSRDSRLGGNDSGDYGPRRAKSKPKTTVRQNADTGRHEVVDYKGKVLHSYKNKSSATAKSRGYNGETASKRKPKLGEGHGHGVGEIEGGLQNPPVYFGDKPNSKVDVPNKGSGKLGAMKPEELTKAIKDAEKMPKGAARTRKLNALNAEKTRRIAAVKALHRQAYEASKLVDTSWPDGKEPLKVHNNFVKRLIKIFPGMRSRLKNIRNEDGTVRGKRALLTILDESVREISRAIAGPLIASGLFTLGIHLVGHGGG